MRTKFLGVALIAWAIALTSCDNSSTTVDANTESETKEASAIGNSKKDNLSDEDFVWQTEQFADLKIIRYQIPG
ncbi:MAG: hypothetical protein AAF193_06500, partial [Bacteroidota bacterium]